jgi:hypothetical protein
VVGGPCKQLAEHCLVVVAVIPLPPLELGGAPRNPKNLWPEPHSQSKLSDPLENKLKRQVCKGVMKLAKARAAIRAFKVTNG